MIFQNFLKYVPKSKHRKLAEEMLKGTVQKVKDFKSDECSGKATTTYEVLDVQFPGIFSSSEIDFCVSVLGKTYVKKEIEKAWGDYWELVKKGIWVVK